MKEEQIIKLIQQEVERAERKHPAWPSDLIHQCAIVAEESGELTKATLQRIYEPEKSSKQEVIVEAIQLGAMVFRFLKNLPLESNHQSS